jgi:hypothetical protein
MYTKKSRELIAKAYSSSNMSHVKREFCKVTRRRGRADRKFDKNKARKEFLNAAKTKVDDLDTINEMVTGRLVRESFIKETSIALLKAALLSSNLSIIKDAFCHKLHERNRDCELFIGFFAKTKKTIRTIVGQWRKEDFRNDVLDVKTTKGVDDLDTLNEMVTTELVTEYFRLDEENEAQESNELLIDDRDYTFIESKVTESKTPKTFMYRLYDAIFNSNE